MKDSLLQIDEKIRKGSFGKLNSFLVYQSGDLLLERYYNGFDSDVLHEFQSVTKSLQSLLIGIALEKGVIESEETPIYNYFKDLYGIDWSNGKEQITIKNLLQMTAGLEWNEGNTPYVSLLNDSNKLAWSMDWVKTALNKPMRNNPGEKFIYSSANPILLSAILNKVYAEGHESFIKKYLFDPLEIKYYDYERFNRNSTILADVEMLPNDMAKIAHMVMQQGMWQGRQCINKNWINNMLQNRVSTHEKNTSYSYGWWHKYFEVGKEKYEFNYAWGYGSQHIFIVKELNLLMICTGKNYEINLHQGPFQLLQEIITIALSNGKK